MSTVRCGNRRVHGSEPVHHESVAQVRLCFHRPEGLPSIEDAQLDEMELEFDPDAAYERFLETRYSDEIAWEEQQEARHLQFGIL